MNVVSSMNDFVEVLLSVYKPDWRYLEEQLSSVVAQNNVQVKVSVRDDTGSDSHMLELQEFVQNKFPGKNNINIIGGINLGPAKSFLELCYLSDMTSDYYAFCDQDDVWDRDKLSRAIECMKNESAGLYASTLYVTNEALDIKYKTAKPKMVCLENSLAENVIAGCTAVFDRRIMKIVKSCRPDYVTMHDHWLYMIGAAFSKIIFDDSSYIKYRQHGANVVGDKGCKYYINKLIGFVSSILKRKKRISDQVASFALCYSERLDELAKRRLGLFLGLRKNIFRRVLNFFSFSRNGYLENAIFKIKFILGYF